MDTQSPHVSIITSYYNDQDFLADSIKSVLGQTYTNLEYILINHASTDNSRQIAHSFTDSRIKHIDLPRNYGASGNILIQKGLEIANGEYIKLHCADDILLPDALINLIQCAEAEQADLVFGNVLLVNKQGKSIGKTWFTHQYPAHISGSKCLWHLLHNIPYLPYAGNLIRAQILQDIPLDYVSIQIADVALWTALLLRGAKLAFSDALVANYRIHTMRMCSVANLDVIVLRCLTECSLFYQHLFHITPSLSLLREIFPNDPFVGQLNEQDKDLIPFVMMHALYISSTRSAHQLACRLKLAEILNNYPLQQRIEQKFKYTIADLRADIIKKPILLLPINYFLYSPDGRGGLKQRIYNLLRKIISNGLLWGWKIRQSHRNLKLKHDVDGFV